MMGSSLKSERTDDHEINELAKKILEQNATKVRQRQQQQQLQQQQQYAASLQGNAVQMARPGQPLMHNYLTQQVNKEKIC